METPHWINRLMAAISDPTFYDGLIVGIAAATLPFIAWMWWSGW